MPRKYLDLLIGRFDVDEKLKLERKERAEIQPNQPSYMTSFL